MVIVMKKLISVLFLTALIGCASTRIQKSSDNLVYMSTLKAPKECKYLGEVFGGHRTEDFIANSRQRSVTRDISELHMQRARVLGGNYVEMNKSMYGGKAYSCPIPALQQLEKSDQ